MTKREYESTGRKLRAAFEALESVADAADYGDRRTIYGATREIVRAADALRGQVCKTCHGRGYFEKPGDPFTSWSCSHEDVSPIFSPAECR
jgi:hypothetical protein